jgi:hypothetical protein
MSAAFTSQPIRRGPKPRQGKPGGEPSQAAPVTREQLLGTVAPVTEVQLETAPYVAQAPLGGAIPAIQAQLPGTIAPAPRARLGAAIPPSRPPPFTPEELSAFLWENYRVQRSPRRLGQLRAAGGGPPYVRDGVVARYPRETAIAWVETLLGAPVRSTSEESARRSLERRDVPTP